MEKFDWIQKFGWKFYLINFFDRIEKLVQIVKLCQNYKSAQMEEKWLNRKIWSNPKFGWIKTLSSY